MLRIGPAEAEGQGALFRFAHRIERHPAGPGQPVIKRPFDGQGCQRSAPHRPVEPEQQLPVEAEGGAFIQRPAARVEDDPAQRTDQQKEDEILPERCPQRRPVALKQHAEELGGEESGFYYGMVARYTYGDADNRTCRFDIARQPSGLWTACFHYDGETPFQSEDWLYLHEHAGRVPMLAIHACADFAADKGMTVFTGGQTLDEWSQMAEIWFWLMEQYEIGNPPEEAVQHLKKLEGIMRQSDFDMTIPELLRGCIDHLNDVMAHTNQPDELRRLMDECAERKDYQGLFVVQCQVAETVLWDCTHVDLWLANLESILREWQKENPA